MWSCGPLPWPVAGATSIPNQSRPDPPSRSSTEPGLGRCSIQPESRCRGLLTFWENQWQVSLNNRSPIRQVLAGQTPRVSPRPASVVDPHPVHKSMLSTLVSNLGRGGAQCAGWSLAPSAVHRWRLGNSLLESALI